MSFDPLALFKRFEHAVVADAETVAKHKAVTDALVKAAETLLPQVNVAQDVEDVTALLKAAGDTVHRAIDLFAAKKAVSAASGTVVPTPPAGFTETPSSPAEPSAAGVEAPGASGSQAVDGAAAGPAQDAAAPPANPS